MRLLLGVWGSDGTTDAVDRTVERAAATGDELTVAIVEWPGTDDADELEQTVRDILDERGVDAEVRRLSGDPGSRLVDLAEREGFDRLLLPGGEVSPMGKIDLSSVTEYALLNSHVTITVLR